jgi:hypothetical protein
LNDLVEPSAAIRAVETLNMPSLPNSAIDRRRWRTSTAGFGADKIEIFIRPVLNDLRFSFPNI